MPGDIFFSQSNQQGTAKNNQIAINGARRKAKNSYPVIITWREINRIGKIQIKCDQTAFFRLTDCDDLLIRKTGHPLAHYRLGIVSRLPKYFSGFPAEMLIQFQPHGRDSTGYSKYLSRAISAP